MSIFGLISEHFWLICLAMCAYSYSIGTRRLTGLESMTPGAASEARSIHQWFAAATFLPWIIMGLGQVLGGVPNVWHYFRPQDLNPYVLGFVGSIFLEAAAFAYWVFFRGGAQKVVNLGLAHIVSPIGQVALTERRVKLFAALGPPFVLFWIYMAISMDVPIRQ